MIRKSGMERGHDRFTMRIEGRNERRVEVCCRQTEERERAIEREGGERERDRDRERERENHGTEFVKRMRKPGVERKHQSYWQTGMRNSQ